MPTRAFVGLDISQADAHVCFLLADGSEPGPRWTTPNTHPGAETLAQSLAQLAQQHAITELRIAMEATGLLWWHLAQHLRAAPVLAPYAPQVYALNPHLVTTFRANYGAIPKTDRVDAFLIAERLRFGRQLPAPFQLDARYAPLQRLTRFRLHLVQNLAREKNYCLSFLFLTFSGFGQVSPFGDPFGATSSAVLEEFTTEELAQQPLEVLTAYLQEKGRGRFGDPGAVAATLQRAARDSYRLERVLQEPCAWCWPPPWPTSAPCRPSSRPWMGPLPANWPACRRLWTRSPAWGRSGPPAWSPSWATSAASTMRPPSPNMPA